ncbi:MAG: methyltransferase [marine bacterium B5-7]|nr:MAG: methyltransferase [marine bacterium B5-7]
MTTTDTITDLYQQLRQALYDGQIGEADVLLKNCQHLAPDAADTWHYAGLLAVCQQDLEAAQRLFLIALEKDDTQPAYHNHFANTCRARQEIDKAIDHYERAIALDAKFSEPHNNLANIYYRQGEMDKALQYYQQAIEIDPHYQDALMNYGYALLKQEDHAGARSQFLQVLTGMPEERIAMKMHYALGQIALTLDENEAAVTHYQSALELLPQYLDARRELIQALLRLEQDKLALKHLNVTLMQDPDFVDDHYNAGVVLLKLNQLNDALYHFREVMRLDENHVETLANLGALALRQGRLKSAQEHYEKLLKIQPENDIAAYTLTALTQSDNPEKPPLAYVQQLFDSYAEQYDEHMQEQLDYQVPELLEKQLSEQLPNAKNLLNVLDLGCGTGLLAETLKPYAKHLTGVDISAAMLTKAQEKQHYDELVQYDIVEFLKQTAQSFDLMCAGDVLNYLGDLAPIFSAARARMSPEGLLCFTIEAGSTAAYQLAQSGRFTHDPTQVAALAESCDWQLVQQTEVILRLQRGQAVPGVLFFFKG